MVDVRGGDASLFVLVAPNFRAKHDQIFSASLWISAQKFTTSGLFEFQSLILYLSIQMIERKSR